MTTNITFYGGWFSKGKFEIKNNELIWWKKKLNFKWFIIPTLIICYYSIPIDEVAYFVPYKSRIKSFLKFIFKSCKLSIGTKNINEDYYIKVVTDNIKDLYILFDDHGSPAMAVVNSVISEKIGTKASIKNFQTVANPNTLWIYPEMIIGVVNNEISRVVCSEARFFTSNRVWRGWTYLPIIQLPKKVTYFGFLEQISIDLNDKDEATVRKHLVDNGAPFAKSPKETVGSCWTPDLLLSPSLWFVRERVALTDDALIYHRRGIKGTEMAYVPYREMSFVISKPIMGIFPAKIYMLGQQNIMTHKRFNAQHLNRLREELHKHISDISESGIIGQPCWLARVCSMNFSKQLIAVSKDGLIIIGKDEDGNKSCGFSPISGIRDWVFVRKHWYSLVSALWITGNYGNIRQDQISEFSAYVTGLWLFKRWKIKALLKTKRSSAYNATNNRKHIKSIIFKENSGNLAGKAVGSAGKSLFSSIFKV